MASEISPAWMASAPSSAPTVFCSTTFIGAGSEPDLSSSASWPAESVVKLPVISPDPVVIGVSMFGAEITRLSRTMAKRLPTLAELAAAKRWVPWPLKRKVMSGRPFWSKAAAALTSISPSTSERRRTTTPFLS